VASAFAACIYHSDDVCSPGEVKDPSLGGCVCPANSAPLKREDIKVVVPTPTDVPVLRGCMACGDHATVVSGVCVCDPGYAKSPSGSEWTNLCIPSNLGATCAAEADCAGGTSTHCQIATGAAAGYCTTTGCASNADCNATEKYACAASASPTFCRRAPLNEGNACSAQGLDPTCGAEAPVCFINHCAMIGCATDGDCSPSRKCCDESALASLPKGSLQVCLEACL